MKRRLARKDGEKKPLDEYGNPIEDTDDDDDDDDDDDAEEAEVK
jgi:hypothetical protein